MDEKTLRAAKNGNQRAIVETLNSIQPFIGLLISRHAGSLKNQMYQDLLAEGNRGALRALNDFDPNRGVKFFTYAYFWIKHYILKAVKTSIKYNARIPDEIHGSQHSRYSPLKIDTDYDANLASDMISHMTHVERRLLLSSWRYIPGGMSQEASLLGLSLKEARKIKREAIENLRLEMGGM